MSLILKFQEGGVGLKFTLRSCMAHSLVADGASEVAIDGIICVQSRHALGLGRSCCWDVGFAILTTNLYSFVSFGKTQKLHCAIDHWLAGVTRQAHFALDGVTKEDTAVQSGHGDDGENKEVNKNSHGDMGGGIEAACGSAVVHSVRSDVVLVEDRLVWLRNLTASK